MSNREERLQDAILLGLQEFPALATAFELVDGRPHPRHGVFHERFPDVEGMLVGVFIELWARWLGVAALQCDLSPLHQTALSPGDFFWHGASAVAALLDIQAGQLKLLGPLLGLTPGARAGGLEAVERSQDDAASVEDDTKGMRASASSKHQFLTIARYHRNETNADRLLLAHLRHLAPSMSKSALRRSTFTFQADSRKPFQCTFDEMKREARETGTVASLHHRLYGADHFFPPTIGVATDSQGFSLKSEYAGHTAEFAGPMRCAAIEDELCGDILWYRRAACERSASTDFVRCTRYYRAYILACTSMVEAFLNRPVLVLAHLRQHVDAIHQLHRPMPFEQRIELWVSTFCRRPLPDLKSTTAWAHFDELRQMRNKLVHASSPQLGVEIRTLERGLNLVREGVGGFMRQLRSMQGLPATNFIERLESAPSVSFRYKAKCAAAPV